MVIMGPYNYGVSTKPKMVIIWEACNLSSFFEHVCLVYVNATTPNHIPLKCKCLHRERNET